MLKITSFSLSPISLKLKYLRIKRKNNSLVPSESCRNFTFIIHKKIRHLFSLGLKFTPSLVIRSALLPHLSCIFFIYINVLFRYSESRIIYICSGPCSHFLFEFLVLPTIHSPLLFPSSSSVPL